MVTTNRNIYLIGIGSEQEMTTEIEMQRILQCALDDYGDSRNDCREFTDVSTFDDAGVFTKNFGLVITNGDGSEFQITIVRSG